jgi:hypothetical protein
LSREPEKGDYWRDLGVDNRIITKFIKIFRIWGCGLD